MMRSSFYSSMQRQRGLSLVEVMVAVTLSLILTIGVLQIFQSTKTTYRVQEGLSRLQETGRFAISFLAKDIRMAGYSGCGNMQNVSVNVMANNPPPFTGGADSVVGFENGVGWTQPAGTPTRVPGTDVIRIQRASESDLRLTGNTDPTNGNIQIGSNPFGFQAEDVLIITDCQSADVFRATTVSGGSTITISHANSNNGGTAPKLSKDYNDDATVMAFISNTYYIGTNPAGNPALYLISLDSTQASGIRTAALLDDVADMQIVYGVDNNGDRMIDAYQNATAVADWATVMSARLAVLTQSPENVQPDAVSVTYNLAGTARTINDARLRQVFSETIAVRNRLP